MIDLYEKGKAKFTWWQDWRGGRIVLVASGHSAKDYDLDVLKGKIRVVGVQASIDLCPFADATYACDENFWVHSKGLPWFTGLKFTYARNVCSRFKDVHRIDLVPNSNELLFKEPGICGSGGNSGFQIFNLVLQFGIKDAILIGFDMDPNREPHWYGRNTWPGATNPVAKSFERWRNAFHQSAKTLTERGINVINAGLQSTIDCFPKMRLEEALNCLRV